MHVGDRVLGRWGDKYQGMRISEDQGIRISEDQEGKIGRWGDKGKILYFLAINSAFTSLPKAS
jgi:hypothetical protein